MFGRAIYMGMALSLCCLTVPVAQAVSPPVAKKAPAPSGGSANAGAPAGKQVPAADSTAGEVKKLLGQAQEALSTGNVGNSHTLVEQAMDLITNAGGEHALELASCYEVLGQTQIAEGTAGLADESFKKAMELREGKLGAKDELVLQTYTEYADLLDKLDRKDEANQLREKVTLARALATAGGGTSKSAAGGGSIGKAGSAFDTYMQSAQKLEKQNDMDGARANWKLAVQEAEKTPKDGRLAFALVHYGDQCHRNKDAAEATALYKRAIEVREQAGATDTLGMARNLSRLATLDMSGGNYAQSESLLRRALEIEDKCNAPDDFLGSTIQSLLSAMTMSKNNSGMEQMCKRLLEIADRSPQDPTAASKRAVATAFLMRAYLESGRRDEAMRMQKQLAAGTPKSMSKDNMQVYQDAYTSMEKKIDDAEMAAFKK
jgi:tetratricopeptide (TPR) repeat protein